jgi:hypothetical protein
MKTKISIVVLSFLTLVNIVLFKMGDEKITPKVTIVEYQEENLANSNVEVPNVEVPNVEVPNVPNVEEPETIPVFPRLEGLATITKEECREIVSVLASDEYEGRKPGSDGDKKTISYVEDQFRRIGLEPINENGYRHTFIYPSKIPLKTSNVVGVIEGTDDTCILLGAHMDHLGKSSVLRVKNRIYNGADDNASGVSALIEIAEAFVESKVVPKHTLIFVAFNAEEMGLIGSRFYVSHPVKPLDKLSLMINLDMIGRLDGKNELDLQSSRISKDLKKLIDKLDDEYPFDFDLIKAGSRSDHANFANQEIPVLFFHTGGHSLYHTTGDEIDTLDFDGLEKLTKFIFDLTFTLAVDNLETNKTSFINIPDRTFSPSALNN